MTIGRDRRWLGVVVVGVVALAALAGAVAVILLSSRSQAPPDLPGVQSFEGLSREHTYEPVSYDQSPPVGGPHYPAWQNAGFYEEPVPNERAVHTLEHGAVWITYEPDLPQDQKNALREIVESQDCLLAAIAYAVGLSKAERCQWYRIAESVPLAQTHASHLLNKLKRAA
jgi:Protein of unknown function (DUF3105)